MRSPRLPLLAPLTVLLGLALVLLAGAPAQAAAFRYWSFWEQQNGVWVLSSVSASGVTPANGSVEGWRFASGGEDTTTMRPPRSTASFAEICGNDAPPAGQKKVAEIIDTGTTADAPAGATVPEPVLRCATVPSDANAVQTLQSVVDVRYEQDMVCGVFGYPATGCGDTVPDSAVATTDPPVTFAAASSTSPVSAPTSSGPPIALIAVGGAVAVLAVVAVLVARRRQP